MDFLPVTKAEFAELGWKSADIILISGDAYIDHPAFAAPLIARWLQHCGYKVALIPQPDWNKPDDFTRFGEPRLFFGITSGNMDSMINKYTARKKIRSFDAYSPDGNINCRPDRATIVYSQIIHSLYKNTHVVIGGLEASMRRLPHYDYWSDNIRNSILFDSRASAIVYGMGENTIEKIAEAINNTGIIPDNIPGTAVITKNTEPDPILLPEYHKKFSIQELRQMHLDYKKHFRQKAVYQKFAGRFLKVNPPAPPLSTQKMDEIYNLPFQRKPHPIYKGKVIKAFEQIKTSVTTHRGCFGGCSFCGIGYHQGKSIQSRSANSILKEISEISKQKYFHGTISDMGGPSANMWNMYCSKNISTSCQRDSCLYPEICPSLNSSPNDLIILLQKASSLPAVKNLFIASGIRFDLALLNRNYIRQMAAQHTSGLLKVAPEHNSSKVLSLMRKPDFSKYIEFHRIFQKYSLQHKKKQSVLPYIIVGHPGSTLDDTIDLALYLKKENVKLKQIQQFIPLPMTDSTLMYITGKDLPGNPINVPKGRELRLMKALIQWFVPENRKLVIEALRRAKKNHLINIFLPSTDK